MFALMPARISSPLSDGKTLKYTFAIERSVVTETLEIEIMIPLDSGQKWGPLPSRRFKT